MFSLIKEFFANPNVVPDPWNNLMAAQLFVFNWESIAETTPFIVFLYMYQPLLPQAYKELKSRNMTIMDKVLGKASFAMVFVYITIGIFGYLTFSDNLEESLLNEATQPVGIS
jgi:amino acid permease